MLFFYNLFMLTKSLTGCVNCGELHDETMTCILQADRLTERLSEELVRAYPGAGRGRQLTPPPPLLGNLAEHV